MRYSAANSFVGVDRLDSFECTLVSSFQMLKYERSAERRGPPSSDSAKVIGEIISKRNCSKQVSWIVQDPLLCLLLTQAKLPFTLNIESTLNRPKGASMKYDTGPSSGIAVKARWKATYWPADPSWPVRPFIIACRLILRDFVMPSGLDWVVLKTKWNNLLNCL